MRPISLEQVNSLRTARQYFCDCYLISSIKALTHTENGRKILQQNISTDGTNFNIRFNHVIDNAEDFFISAKSNENLFLRDKFNNRIKIDEPQNPIMKAIEVAMGRLIFKYPLKKPLISYLVPCNEMFEYNKPSNFMEMFTGRIPIVLNEGGFRQTLKHHSEEAMQLFEQIDKAGETSFIVGTGIFSPRGLADVHCYNINGINYANKYIEIFENREKETITLPFDKAIRSIKYLTGYFNSDLK